MKDPAILHPVFALVAWTLLVLCRLALARLTSGLAPRDFRLGESAAVPPEVVLPNRNYMNLLELPSLFYVACLVLYATGPVPRLALVAAWSYVGLRIVHSLIHLGYNNVIHRLLAFALSNFCLIGLWVCTWLSVHARA